ncbi:MAG: glycosyltransferase [Opitutae bacterium]|nr:glycosyltransferase [Opitutae bacterium]
MNPRPSILTNMAFHQSRTWRAATTTLCREGESPDDLPPLRQAFRLLRLRSRFDAVVTLGPRPSLAYGLLCALLHLPSKQIMTEVFLDPPRPASLPWRIKTALFRWISRRSLGLLANSSAEVGLLARRFGIPEAKLRFVPMYTTLADSARAPDNDGYVLSIGRTLRDWETLLRAAPQFKAPLRLVAGKDDRLPAQLPPAAQVFRELSLEEGHGMMRRAALVVIPLLPAERSTGQVVLFEAMAMGKPVVATRVAGTLDYLRDGENGLLVEPGDAPALARAVNRLLEDPALAARISETAWADCQTHLDPETHAKRKIKEITALWLAR